MTEPLLSGLDDVVYFGKTFTHYEQHGGEVTAFFDGRRSNRIAVAGPAPGSGPAAQFRRCGSSTMPTASRPGPGSGSVNYRYCPGDPLEPRRRP